MKSLIFVQILLVLALALGGGVARADEGHNETAEHEYEGISKALESCATSGVRVSSDEWTPSGSQPPNCTFPFLYRDQLHYGCINRDYFGRYWCANSCDFTKDQTKRGECVLESRRGGTYGLGVAMSLMNVFIGILMTTVAVLGLLLCLVHCRTVRSSRVEDEGMQLPGGEFTLPKREVAAV